MTSRAARPSQIPPPVAALIDERLQGAACAKRAPAFDAEIDGESEQERSHRLALAARICHGCQVRTACKQAALEQGEPQGLWGGVPFGEPRRPGQKGTAA